MPGCTHYPLIEHLFRAALPPQTHYRSASWRVAEALGRLSFRHPKMKPHGRNAASLCGLPPADPSARYGACHPLFLGVIWLRAIGSDEGTAMREVVLDTETTGFDPVSGDRLVEIGCLELWNHIPTGKNLQLYLNPERDMPEAAFQIHGSPPNSSATSRNSPRWSTSSSILSAMRRWSSTMPSST